MNKNSIKKEIRNIKKEIKFAKEYEAQFLDFPKKTILSFEVLKKLNESVDLERQFMTYLKQLQLLELIK